MIFDVKNDFSSDRFEVDYQVAVNNGQDITAIGQDICIEQTVEVPKNCIPENHIKQGIPGIIENLKEVTPTLFLLTISYRCDLTAYSISQFLNTLFGNISLKNNIRIIAIRIPDSFTHVFPGPSFGIDGIRKLTGVYNRPLTCTALKPVGLNSKELSEIAYKFASGGADIIKDDHGITNQPFSRFCERVEQVFEAVCKARTETGHTTIYCPMLNDDPELLFKQIDFCKKIGIEGILAAPLLIGCGTFAFIARQKRFVLMAHPAFSGTFFSNHYHGAKPAVLLGILYRLFGADISIFPNAGGRFTFSQQDCIDICNSLRKDLNGFPSAFPAPAGGMRINRIKELSKIYGKNSVFIIGGDLLQQPSSLLQSTQAFVNSVKSNFPDYKEIEVN